MKLRRSFRTLLALAVLSVVGIMFVTVIWIPLYQQRDLSRSAGSLDSPAVQVDVVREDGKETRSWTIADQQAIAKLRAGLQSTQAATAEAPPSEEKYRLRIKRLDSRVDEYEVVLGPEGRMQDRVYVIRRTGGTSVYGTAVNTPELRSALQQVLVPTAATQSKISTP
jgi:hypothetical protein